MIYARLLNSVQGLYGWMFTDACQQRKTERSDTNHAPQVRLRTKQQHIYSHSFSIAHIERSDAFLGRWAAVCALVWGLRIKRQIIYPRSPWIIFTVTERCGAVAITGDSSTRSGSGKYDDGGDSSYVRRLALWDSTILDFTPDFTGEKGSWKLRRSRVAPAAAVGEGEGRVLEGEGASREPSAHRTSTWRQVGLYDYVCNLNNM